MGIIDLVILAILVFAGFGGLRKGLIRQVAALAGLLFGIWGQSISRIYSQFSNPKVCINHPIPFIDSVCRNLWVILVGIHFRNTCGGCFQNGSAGIC